jgi:hypothetical protein
MAELPSNPDAKLMPGHPFFDLIEEAYRVFKCPKPQSTEVCNRCCMDPYIEKHFFDPPIRELPLHYVQDWYDAAYQPPGIAKSKASNQRQDNRGSLTQGPITEAAINVSGLGR